MFWMTEMIIIITVEVLKRSIIPWKQWLQKVHYLASWEIPSPLKKITTMEKVWIDFDDFTFPFTP